VLCCAIAAVALLVSGIALALPDQGVTGAGSGHPAGFASTPVAMPARATASEPGHVAQAALTIGSNAYTVPVPASYFGLSTEYWGLPVFEQDMPAFERVLSLLHVHGGGPMVLRIGGDSADHSFWTPNSRRMPRWLRALTAADVAYPLTPAFLGRLRSLVEHDHVRLIVDLNLVTDTPLIAATWARAARTSLPYGSIIGFEVGNEPDLYARRYWLAALARSPLQSVTLPLELTATTYVEDFTAYASVLGENAPDIPLVGPAVAHPRDSLSFISTLIANEPELGLVSGHLYPYSACVKQPRSSSYPTVARLLSWQASGGLTKDVAGAVATAHAAGLKFRLTEINSVTCGGKPGVSDTFATALWAPDALFTLMRAGVDGVNLHVRALKASNAPFKLTRYGLTPRPLLYGLIMFERMLGPEARLVRVQTTHARSLNLSAWAVRVRGDLLHVLVIDKSNRTVRVDLRLPATGPATVQQLLAPSASATTGETLDGQRLGRNATWIGRRVTETIRPGAHGYELTLPRLSAALVGVRIAPAVAGLLARRTGHHGANVRHRGGAHHGAKVRHRGGGHPGATIVAERPGRRGARRA
jgi:hypothetical protein